MATFKIMTFDGGGIRGSLVAALLRRLENRFPELLTNVDLFAGTSTGSAIALSLAHGRSTAQLQALYSEEEMKFVFGKSRWNFIRPKHSNKNLRKLLEKNFKVVPEKQGGLTLSDLKKNALVTSFKLDDEAYKSWSPVFFHNLPHEDTCTEPSANISVVDVALRSAAAPTIFPSHQGHIDGGMVANNPSTAAIAVALRRKKELKIDDIRLLSFGTGFNPTIVKTDTTNWGVLQWLVNPFHHPREPLLSILFDGVVEADDFMSREILGEDRYHRLNLELPTLTTCDDWRQVPNLVKLANSKEDKVEKMIDGTVEWLQKHWSTEGSQAAAAGG